MKVIFGLFVLVLWESIGSLRSVRGTFDISVPIPFQLPLSMEDIGDIKPIRQDINAYWWVF